MYPTALTKKVLLWNNNLFIIYLLNKERNKDIVKIKYISIFDMLGLKQYIYIYIKI